MSSKKDKNRKNAEKIVISVLSDYFNISPKNISTESRLIEDLGMDSFGLVELTFELKEKLGIELKKEDISKIHTVSDIIDYIETFFKGVKAK